MDRTFLYTVVVFLTIALGGVYVQKSNPDFFSGLLDLNGTSEQWIEKDPGWDRNQPMPKTDPNTPTPPQNNPAPSPIPPPDDNVAPSQPTPPPSDPEPDRRFPRLRPNRPGTSPGCPGCR